MNQQPFNIEYTLMGMALQRQLALCLAITQGIQEAREQEARAKADHEWAQQQFDFLTVSR